MMINGYIILFLRIKSVGRTNVFSILENGPVFLEILFLFSCCKSENNILDLKFDEYTLFMYVHKNVFTICVIEIRKY